MFITTSDLISMRRVEDSEVNELLQEALMYDVSLMMTENHRLERKSVFHGWKKISVFRVYHEQFDAVGRSTFQARQQLSASGSKEVVMAYLYGIINGALNMKDMMQD